MKTEGQQVKRGPITIENLLKLPLYFVRGLKYHAAGRVYTPKPLFSTLVVTHRCNSRCIMCSYWKRQDSEKDLTVTEIGEIFRNPLFSSLETIALSGGEPILREDLVQIAQAILDSCPQIKGMTLLTNGLEPSLVVKKVKELLALTNTRRLNRFSVSVSLDGCGATHEKIRGIPQAFEKVSETIDRLKRLQHQTPFYLSSACVVQPLNINNLVELSDFGEELGLPITFAPVCVSDVLLRDAATKDSLKFTDDQVKQLKTSFDRKQEKNLQPSNVPFWREYFSIINGKKRRLPCFLVHHFAGVDSDGTLYMCAADSSLVYGNVRDESPDKIWYSVRAKEVRKRAEKYFCPSCTVCCNTAFSFSHEFFYYAGFLLKEKTRKLFEK